MLDNIFKLDRRLRLEHKKLSMSDCFDIDITKIVDNYLAAYADFYGLAAEDILALYNSFLSRYMSDVGAFLSTGKYPPELNSTYEPSRQEYDVALILSTVLTEHRHRILSLTQKVCSNLTGRTLIVGVGPGLELELINSNEHLVDAYDLTISGFTKSRFGHFNLQETYFEGQKEFYDNILAIELLEHLSDPFSFCEMCYNSLALRGQFITTTATDIPQFDHLYNFKDVNELNKEAVKMGFDVTQEIHIEHHYIKDQIKPKNSWYILTRI